MPYREIERIAGLFRGIFPAAMVKTWCESVSTIDDNIAEKLTREIRLPCIRVCVEVEAPSILLAGRGHETWCNSRHIDALLTLAY